MRKRKYEWDEFLQMMLKITLFMQLHVAKCQKLLPKFCQKGIGKIAFAK